MSVLPSVSTSYSPFIDNVARNRILFAVESLVNIFLGFLFVMKASVYSRFVQKNF